MKQQKNEIQEKENDVLTLARTIYGEARGESTMGKKAIACVVLNRYKSGKWFAGTSIAETCLKKFQFSCWNENDPNKKKIENMKAEDLGECYEIACHAVNGHQPDIVFKSTHYHTENIHPKWAENKVPVVKIGHHLFYNDVL